MVIRDGVNNPLSATLRANNSLCLTKYHLLWIPVWGSKLQVTTNNLDKLSKGHVRSKPSLHQWVIISMWCMICLLHFFFSPQLFWLRTFTRLLDSQKILLNITGHHSICITDKFVSVILVSIFPGGEKNKTHVTAFPKWRLFCQMEANIELPEFQRRHEVVFNIFGFSSIMLLGTRRCLSLSRYYTTQ